MPAENMSRVATPEMFGEPDCRRYKVALESTGNRGGDFLKAASANPDTSGKSVDEA